MEDSVLRIYGSFGVDESDNGIATTNGFNQP